MARKSESRAGRIAWGPLFSRTLTALLLGAVGAGAVFGTPALQARVSRSMSATPAWVEFDWPRMSSERGDSTWLSPDIQAGLIRLVKEKLSADADPLSVRALERVGAALLETGWFEALESVRRDTGGLVRIRGRWRVPGAVVRHGGVDHLVSRAGELLAPTYLPGQSGQRVILGAASPPPSKNGRVVCGEVWGGLRGTDLSDVQAGVQLLNLLASRPCWGQVAGVDVSDYASKRRLEIVTAAGTRVAWGGAPGEQVFGEPPLETKLWRLAELQRRFGRIDGGQQHVDISGVIATIDETPAAPGR